MHVIRCVCVHGCVLFLVAVWPCSFIRVLSLLHLYVCCRGAQKYKSHPAVLIWSMANMVEYFVSEDEFPRVFSAVNDLAAMVKSIDPDHPTMVSMETAYNSRPRLFEALMPGVDIMGVNAQGSMPRTVTLLDQNGFTRAWMPTEFGTDGYWQRPRTSWGRPLELDTRGRAEFLDLSFDAVADPRSIGTFPFIWGAFPSDTLTTFDMFLSPEIAPGLAKYQCECRESDVFFSFFFSGSPQMDENAGD